MEKQDKLDELYEKHLVSEAIGKKGFTITCNKCGATSNIPKNTGIVKGEVELELSGTESGEGYSVGGLLLDCKKCKNNIELEQENMYWKR